jgi:hypothetical protein
MCHAPDYRNNSELIGTDLTNPVHRKDHADGRATLLSRGEVPGQRHFEGVVVDGETVFAGHRRARSGNGKEMVKEWRLPAGRSRSDKM